eukprot:1641064-Amphidinium_carterae.1
MALSSCKRTDLMCPSKAFPHIHRPSMVAAGDENVPFSPCPNTIDALDFDIRPRDAGSVPWWARPSM